jgi:hypothetical protein
LNGAFDFATLESVTDGIAGQLHFTVTTTYPEAIVSQVCTSTQVAPAATRSNEFEMGVLHPSVLSLPGIDLTPDRKSLIVEDAGSGDGWTWTMTPSPAK